MLPDQSICFIAISGGSGSGKSTLAQALLQVLGPEICTVMGDDHYYKSRRANDAVGLSRKDVEAKVNFDDPSSKDMDLFYTHLASLRSGNSIERPFYSFPDHDRVKDKTHTVSPGRVTILEGIHVLSETRLQDLFDLKIYVDTPDDLRLARRILRDTAPIDEGGRGRSVQRVISQYLKFVRPTHHRVTEPFKYAADLVIADEGLPAFASAAPSRQAVLRMLAPVLNWLLDEGVINDTEINGVPDDIVNWLSQ